MNAAIAKHLNIAESAIIRVEEWAHVLFAVVRGIGARFISKKVVKMEKEQVQFLDVKLLSNNESTPIGKILVLTPHDLEWWLKAPKTIVWTDNDGIEWEAKLTSAQSKKVVGERKYRVTGADRDLSFPVVDVIKQLGSMPANAKITNFQLSDFVRR